MKIQIRSSEHDIDLYLPNRVIFSRFCIRLLTKSLAAKSKNIDADAVGKKLGQIMPSAEQLRALRLEVERMKTVYPDWVFVDMVSDDGDSVHITL